MANFGNMNITNSIKGLVSKRRNRYKKDGFNLDLTCILFLNFASGIKNAGNKMCFGVGNLLDVVSFQV